MSKEVIELLQRHNAGETLDDKSINKIFTEYWKAKTAPSLHISTNVGNIYTGSLYACLISLIANEKIQLENKRILMFQKAKLEIMQFFFLIVLLFFGGSNIILLIFYGNFLKTKWMINAQTKSAFSEINNWVEGKINHRFCPGIVRFIVNKVRAFCAYMVRM